MFQDCHATARAILLMYLETWEDGLHILAAVQKAEQRYSDDGRGAALGLAGYLHRQPLRCSCHFSS